jgi:S-adenosylmethionine-diacylgycerolhomoserine-N-methlytransferase
MGFASDLKILYHLALKPVRGKDHAARMESFYAGQAEAYDDFRKRLLKGRQELWNLIEIPAGGAWLDMGGGTGANLDYFGDRLGQLGKVYVLDLSHSLCRSPASGSAPRAGRTWKRSRPTLPRSSRRRRSMW